ncbi:MAG: LLM class flavin-dependent oxidoreductase [Pseudomonadota bacterium]|uniref:LLM class flavin-dependent oxidoreductase n=1 Tax=Phenylobacterium sp. TaxID=1871053 RepID=UPI0025FD30F8|nr:LLM class flavin-dependent oxidoreductase [Phenylobacterium sp.]MBT9470219.1 LLM class flavin-dependent oxidoreductase [Phenylobacterium sp.]
MTTRKQLKLGHMIEGAGRTWTDWRHPDAQPGASTNFAYYKDAALLAERGKFDFLFIADSLSINEKSSPHYLNRFEPITILSALAAVTEHVGLVATLSVTYSEPFNVARQFASLDHISGGRAGWNVVTSWLEGSADNFGKEEHPAHDVRYRLAAEYLDVVQGLWDSWEDDALVHDKANGVFFDPEKLNTLGHKGDFLSVKGPLNIARSAQGQPVIFQAGASEDGRNFAAKRADAIFVGHGGIQEARDYYADVKARAAGFGRDPASLFILPAVAPIIGSTEAEANARWQERADLVSIESALAMLGRSFNDHDFTVYELDAPFPDVFARGFNSSQSATLKIAHAVQKENLTLRQVAQRFATPKGELVGTPEQIADKFEEWLVTEASDGFVVGQPLPGQFRLFVEEVTPILQKRGILRETYEGSTFRDSLGLEVPANRFTVAKAERAVA